MQDAETGSETTKNWAVRIRDRHHHRVVHETGDGSTDPGKYSKYVPGPACNELIEKHAAKLKEYDETVRSTVKALLPLKPDHLKHQNCLGLIVIYG